MNNLQGLINSLPQGSSNAFSGITGTISYTYDNSAQYVSDIIRSATDSIISIVAIILVFSMMLGIYYAYMKILSAKRYRMLMSDMYVVGKVKQYAKTDGIDLNEELKDYSRILRKSGVSYKDLDVIVEENLKNKISADADEKDKK